MCDRLFCMMDESSRRPVQVDGDGAAKRRRLRRLRSWWRHEQQTVAAVLATMQHHSAPRGQKAATKASEGEVREQYYGLRGHRSDLSRGCGQHRCRRCCRRWCCSGRGERRVMKHTAQLRVKLFLSEGGWRPVLLFERRR